MLQTFAHELCGQTHSDQLEHFPSILRIMDIVVRMPTTKLGS